MARRSKAKSAVPYLEWLAQDKYVQEQLGNAATRLTDAYGRVSRQGGKAAEDKKLYGNLREAATSIRKATLALRRRRPEPKRRGRKVLLLVLAGGAAAVVLSGRRREKLQGALSSVSGASTASGEADAWAPVGSSSSQQSAPAAPSTRDLSPPAPSE